MDNELMSLLPEYVPLGVIVYNKEGHLKYANNFALKMFGTTIEEVYDIVNIFEDPNIGAEDKALLKQGYNVSFETDYDFELCEQFYDSSMKRGNRKYFVTKVTIMRDAEGTQKGYVLTCEDITEKKQQEQEIIESVKKIKSTQKELSLALNAGKLSSWNYQTEEEMFYKFDVQVENIEKRTLHSICESVHPDDKEKFSTLLDAILQKKLQENSFVLRVWEDAYQDYRYCNFLFSAREDEEGQINVVTFIQRDITEDIKYQQNLILAKNKAEEADKLKSTFLANMSHEIRTPLNAIVGFSALLSETDDKDEKVEFKQLIETNSDVLLKLIGDILDLSKIEVGSIDINRQKLNLPLLCDELFRSFQQRIKNPNVTLRLVSPYTKCYANFDKHRFIQIFTNFVTNAIKYTPEGEIVMGYECSPGQVRLYVKDTGIGIPDEKKHRIFSRFEKLDTFAQGTGLGLSICKAIADATGGEVGFESKENEGSEFWYLGCTEVEFVEKADLKDENVELDEDMLMNEDCPKVKGLNILIAEDNDSNYLLIRNLLGGNALTRAITGAEAVEKLNSQTFDVILMDMRMPVMNGLEATIKIREFNRIIPIIAVTANAFNSDKEAALAAGCNYFMTKPVKKRELMEVLSKYCLSKI